VRLQQRADGGPSPFGNFARGTPGIDAAPGHTTDFVVLLPANHFHCGVGRIGSSPFDTLLQHRQGRFEPETCKRHILARCDRLDDLALVLPRENAIRDSTMAARQDSRRLCEQSFVNPLCRLVGIGGGRQARGKLFASQPLAKNISAQNARARRRPEPRREVVRQCRLACTAEPADCNQYGPDGLNEFESELQVLPSLGGKPVARLRNGVELGGGRSHVGPYRGADG
jgi:hypothetical protein